MMLVATLLAIVAVATRAGLAGQLTNKVRLTNLQ